MSGLTLISTVAESEAVPFGPVQVKVYVVREESEPVDCEPEVGLLPDQPPEAVQEVTLVVDQESVDEPPELTAEGLAVRLTDGDEYASHGPGQ